MNEKDKFTIDDKMIELIENVDLFVEKFSKDVKDLTSTGSNLKPEERTEKVWSSLREAFSIVDEDVASDNRRLLTQLSGVEITLKSIASRSLFFAPPIPDDIPIKDRAIQLKAKATRLSHKLNDFKKLMKAIQKLSAK